MRLSINSRLNDFRLFLSRIEQKDVPEDVKSSLYKFSAIRLCGHLEQCVKIVILERIKSRAHPKLISYVKSNFKSGANLRCTDIVDLLNRFDIVWGKNLESFVKKRPDIKEAIESIYSIRNPIAHGTDASLGRKTLSNYFLLIEELIEEVIISTE